MKTLYTSRFVGLWVLRVLRVLPVLGVWFLRVLLILQILWVLCALCVSQLVVLVRGGRFLAVVLPRATNFTRLSPAHDYTDVTLACEDG